MSFAFSSIPPNLISDSLGKFLKGDFDSIYPPQTDTQLKKIQSELQSIWDTRKRSILYEVLQKQHQSLKPTQQQELNLQALRDSNALTVTTGQQIHPFLGPAFVWAKVTSTILKSKELSQNLGIPVVPVFWMATEDHDFEEISTVPFLGKEYHWIAPHGGPVGNLDTQGIAFILEQMKSDFQHDIKVLDYLNQFEGIYGKGESLTEASRKLIHKLFGESGLLIVDPNEAIWKKHTEDIWLRELEDHPFESLSIQADKMKELGLKAPITPRQTSMFYYGNGLRLRLDKQQNGMFQTANGEFIWNKNQLKDEITAYPERFSANALLRPAYQQRILPNLMYIGGPSECLYWLQVPNLIVIHKGVVPVIQLRILMHLSTPAIEKKLLNFPWDKMDWFDSEDSLLQRLTENEFGNLSLTHQMLKLKEQFESIWESLYQLKHPKLREIKKEHQAVLKSLQNTHNDFIKDGFDTHIAPKVKQLKALKNNVFNEKSPQERKLFWMEWDFKLGGFPQIENCSDSYLWFTAK